MKKRNLIILSFLLLLIVGCSSSKETTVKENETKELKEMFTQEVEADFSELTAWVNLMPNAGNKFHISGIVDVSENFKYDIQFIRLRDILIQQNDKVLYKISPIVQLDPELSTDTKKTFRFSTSSGLSLTPELNIEQPCVVEFHFYDGSDLYKYILENVLIEKTY